MGLLDRLKRRFSAPVYVGGVAYDFDEALRMVSGMSAGDLYKTQPHLRTVTAFLGRNIAHLGLHAYRRIDATDRERDTTSPVGVWLSGRKANPTMTLYDLVFALVVDLALYDRAFLLPYEGDSGWEVYRVPPAWVTPARKDALGISEYNIGWGQGAGTSVSRDKIVAVEGYSPSSVTGVSPAIDALKDTLAEQIQAMKYRRQLWARGGRVSSVLTRPQGAPRWSDAAREAFREDWYAKYTGDGVRAGGTPILEDGMDLKKIDFSASDQQYIQGAKLSFSTVAAAFHVNPTMVGVLDNANYSNVREFRKMLYGDTLGPLIAQLESALNAWLLPIMRVDEGIYLEFNVAEKLQGDFEAQSAFFQSAVGRPYMSANEARAKLNMHAVEGGDDIVTPLNVLVGGQASPKDSAPSGSGVRGIKSRQGIPEWVDGVTREYVAVLSGDTKDARRAKKLKAISVRATERAARGAIREHGSGDYDTDRTEDYLEARAEGVEQAWEDTDDDSPEALSVFASGLALWDYSWGRLEAGRQNGAATKTWVTTSSNPRAEHAAMNGETVGLDEEFSNGLRWPGDSASGDPAEVANCRCEVVVNWA